MQSLQPDPKAQYKSVYGALKKIIHTEGFWRPLRGINVTVLGAGPAHAMYFACYEKMKRTLSDIIHHGGNSHLANGILQLFAINYLSLACFLLLQWPGILVSTLVLWEELDTGFDLLHSAWCCTDT